MIGFTNVTEQVFKGHFLKHKNAKSRAETRLMLSIIIRVNCNLYTQIR